MKDFIEITPGKRTLYRMPDATFDLVVSALRERRARSFGQIIKLMPNEMVAEINAQALSTLPHGLRGLDPHAIFVDELIKLTPEERKVLLSRPNCLRLETLGPSVPDFLSSK